MRRLGPEAARGYQRRVETGFFDRYLAGPNVLDIGFRGGDPEAEPITETAIGIDLDYPGYDGVHLPFEDRSQDAVFASHCYEHIADYRTALREWYRVLRVGGYLVIIVPHKYLYERKSTPPSFFNPDHKRFYTPASLLLELEEALPVNGFRVRHLADNDEGFDYAMPSGRHGRGSYEIELVAEKIERPPQSDEFEPTPERRGLLASVTSTIIDAIEDVLAGRLEPAALVDIAAGAEYFPCYEIIRAEITDRRGNRAPEARLRDAIGPMLSAVRFDERLYLQFSNDVREAVEQGLEGSAREHFVKHGYFEGRIFQPDPAVAAAS